MTENCCSLDYCWNWLCAIKSFLELKPASHDTAVSCYAVGCGV